VSVHALSWAKRQKTGSPTRKLVLMTLADYANDNGVAWPSQQTIAAETELTDRSIRNALVDLEAGEFLKRESRPVRPNGQRQTDLIYLNLSATGKIVRRQKPPENDDRLAEPVSGKPPRNNPYQGRGAYLSGYSAADDGEDGL